MSSQIIKSTFFDNKVLSIELNNPLKRNALSLKMLDTLTMIVSQKNLENRYKILVLRGYQDGVFSAGAPTFETWVDNTGSSTDPFCSLRMLPSMRLKRAV